VTPAVSAPRAFRPAGFRLQLWVAMMLIISAVTVAVLYLAEANLESNVAHESQREFQGSLAELDHVQAIRHAALVERCRALVGRPRIHAALEDNAPDLLYPSAEDDLSDLMDRALFYRFLGPDGAVIPPQKTTAAGPLLPLEEAELALPMLSAEPQTGYLIRHAPGGDQLAEIIGTPILSSETGEVIAALVLGFRPPENPAASTGLRSGLFVGGARPPGALAPPAPGVAAFPGHLYSAPWDPSIRQAAESAVSHGLAAGHEEMNNVRLDVSGAPQWLFYKRLNPGSRYLPAYQVAVYSLAPLVQRQRQLRWNILALAGAALLGALVVSHFATRRLSAPVEKLAVDSERSARFSADASHQLKTPVTVLRAGLEELLARPDLSAEECAGLSDLIHQTYRLSTLVDDLLLLSRMDSGRLKLRLEPVNLGQLIEASVDDLGAQPDSEELAIEAQIPPDRWIAGEKRYTAIILQNLLENARKYNRAAGRIRIAARTDGESVWVSVGNTGSTIPAAAQAHIFERFHRGGVGENKPGHGLGLNLARELARIHQGELRLARSADDWTEFELRLASAATLATATEKTR
jgi:signal transduction histidine kinase